jgi:hypothetical protein
MIFMKNDDGSPLVEDHEKAKELLKRNGNNKIVRSLIQMNKQGLLNVFEDGTISLTEKARPMAEKMEEEAKKCIYNNPKNCHECLKDASECFPPPTCKKGFTEKK